MRLGAVAEAVTHLAWVPPTVPSLLALARSTAPNAWPTLRDDPGAVLLLLRSPSVAQLPPELVSLDNLPGCPDVLDLAARLLRDEGEGRCPDWSVAGRAAVLDAARWYARQAERLAGLTGRCDPVKAWAAGLLTPLGWLAAAFASPSEVADCLADPSFARDPAGCQRRRWGLDAGELARRLCRRWALPPWLTAVAGHLDMPLDVAVQFGADPDLFRTIQLAVTLVQRVSSGLSLAVGAGPAELLQAVGVSFADVAGPLTPPESNREEAPDAPRLAELLALAAENRRLRAARGDTPLEEELDVLHRALAEQRGQEAERLRSQKLGALAEFAAGAGHEINNPLAVISGQAQYLLGHESEPERRKALEAIVGQTRRIHQLLRDVMQFARPPAPNLQVVDLARVVDETAVALAEYAAARKVRLRVREPEPGQNGHHCQPLAALLRPEATMTVLADAVQLRTALTCLLRNAIEAVPPEGWASIRLTPGPTGSAEVVIEDSGQGLPPAQREHLFDPFYSGRAAGRGPGLGLPTAWSLARQQGGDVFLASQPGEPTRFVLRLPLHVERTPALAS